MIKQSSWLFPFIFFIGGYVAIRSLLHSPSIQAPSVIGLSLNEAFIILSNQNLNIRLLELKEDCDLPEGTVINQIPAPTQHIKPRQTIFLTLSKQPPQLVAPSCVGKDEKTIENALQRAGLKAKKYYVASDERTGICIGQNPSAGDPLDFKIISLYIACPTSTSIIWPNFIGRHLNDVIDFLAPYNLEPHVEKNSYRGTIITDQRPLPGSIVDLDQKPYVQLHV